MLLVSYTWKQCKIWLTLRCNLQCLFKRRLFMKSRVAIFTSLVAFLIPIHSVINSCGYAIRLSSLSKMSLLVPCTLSIWYFTMLSAGNSLLMCCSVKLWYSLYFVLSDSCLKSALMSQFYQHASEWWSMLCLSWNTTYIAKHISYTSLWLRLFATSFLVVVRLFLPTDVTWWVTW